MDKSGIETEDGLVTRLLSAIFFSLSVLSCAAVNGLSAGQQPSLLIEITSGHSLVAPGTPLTQAIFLYRAVEYLTQIESSVPAIRAYAGHGLVRGLNRPEDIAGTYTSDTAGKVWRNQNGVEIVLNSPVELSGSSGTFQIYYVGPRLPRQA